MRPCIALLLSLTLSVAAAAQENNPLIVSGQLLEKAGNLYDSGEYKKAIDIYRQIDRNDTNYVRALRGVSSSLYGDSQFTASIACTRQALALSNTDPEIRPLLLNTLGNDYNELNQCEQAIRVYDSAIQEYPYYSLFYQNKGTALIKLKRFAEAEPIFQKAVMIDPYSYTSHYKMGFCALKQGKLIPAVFGFLGYLVLNPEGNYRNFCIDWLSAIAHNKDTIQVFLNERKGDPDERYQQLEQILQSKIALDKGYKPLTQLDDPIPRQIQAIFEKMDYQPDDKDFYMQYYVPLFKRFFTTNQFEPFVNRIFLSVNVPTIQEYNKKHKKELKALTDDLVAYLDALRANQELDYSKRSTDTTMYSFSDNGVGKGMYLKKTDKLVGPWTFLYTSGNIKGSGAYNPDGTREGSFTWYHFNGKIKGKEIYHNGKQEGEEHYYFSNGQVSSHSWYKGGQLDGESTSYYWVGTPNSLTRYQAGKEQGIKVSFRANGDTSLIENYTAGIRDGEARSFTKFRTIDVIASYKNDVLDGHYRKFYANGKLSSEGDYVAGKMEGEWKTWFDDGHIKDIAHYVHDKAEGDYKVYYANGTLYISSTSRNGKVNGEVRYNDEDGKVFSILNYSNGNLQKAQYFDKLGKVVGHSEAAQKSIFLTQYLPDGSKRGESTYDEKNDLTGIETFFYPSGAKESATAYEHGEINGLSINYFPNGNRSSQNTYADGKLEGYHQTWFMHGQIHEEGWYTQDNSDGYWIYHNELGDLTDSVHYSEDMLNGYKTSYSPAGKKTYEWKYLNGWMEQMSIYDTSGRELRHIDFDAGSGLLNLSYPNGQAELQLEYRRSQPVGPKKEWYFDGKPSALSHFTQGLRDSAYISWYHSGKVNTEGQYHLDEKTGEWKYHDREGHLTQTDTYVHDDLEGPETLFYPDGKPEKVIAYHNGKREGATKYYDQDGTLLLLVNYHEGDPVSYSYLDSKDSLLPAIPLPGHSGKIRALFPNGKVSAEMEYKDSYSVGDYKLYYSNGQLKSVSHRNYGDMEGEYRVYFRNGQLQESEQYVHDNPHGVHRIYNDKGVLIWESNYYNGEPQGITKLFDDNGHLTETDTYYYGNLISAKK